MYSIFQWVTTGSGFEGHPVERVLGVVCGAAIRNCTREADLGRSFRETAAEDSARREEASETARREAFERMVLQAASFGANAVVSMRFDSSPIEYGVTEIIAYGTAVRLAGIPWPGEAPGSPPIAQPS